MVTQHTTRVLQPKLQQAAAAGQLGSFLKSYGAAAGEIVKNLGIGIVGLIMGAVLASVLLIGMSAHDTSIGAALLFGAFAFFFLAGGLYTVYEAIKSSGQRVYLFQQGVLLVRWGWLSVHPWTQIQTIRQQITRHYKRTAFGEKEKGTTYKYIIKRVDGKKLELDNQVKNIEELGETITQQFSTFLLPIALAELQASKTIDFGSWTINFEGIRNKKGLLSWQDIQGYQIVGGRLHILRKNGAGYWDTNLVRSIDNVFVFTALVDTMAVAVRR